MTRRKIAIAVGVCALSVSVAACGSSSGGSSSGGGGESSKHTITFVSAGVSQPAFIPLECGIVKTAEKLGVGLERTGAQQQTGPATAQVLRALQAKSPEGAIVDTNVPEEDAAPIEELVNTGTTVVEVDNLTEAEGPGAQVALDNVKQGETAAKLVAEQMGGKGQIVVMDYEPGYTTLEQRFEGIENMLSKEFPEVELLPDTYSGGSAQKAASILKATKVRYPELAGVISTGNVVGEVVGGIFENNPSLQGKIKNVTTDLTARLVEELESGAQTGLANGNFYDQGVLSTEALVGLLEGEKVPTEQFVPSVVITQENLNEPNIQSEIEKATSGKC